MKQPQRILGALLALVLLAVNGSIATSGQLLAYQDGFVFFTTGDGYKVSPDVAILDAKTQKPTHEQPRPRLFARAVFNPLGVVTELDLSHSALPPEPGALEAQHFAVALTPSVPNPELAAPKPTHIGGVTQTFSGKPVLVIISVEVPPTTPLSASVYITTDTSGWNPEAIALQRIDIRHFRVIERYASGTILNYLYTRGSLQTEEVAENGLSRKPRAVIVNDADVRAINDVVYQWADTISGGTSAQPNAIPTPYNPVPFPNLPIGAPTPHP